VQSWQFNASFVHWNSSTAQAQADNLIFNGTLGATTLQATAGDWQVYYGPESNAYLALYGQPSPPFFERWGWCTSTQSCAATGDAWQLTLVSATPEAPEALDGGSRDGGRGGVRSGTRAAEEARLAAHWFACAIRNC